MVTPKDFVEVTLFSGVPPMCILLALSDSRLVKLKSEAKYINSYFKTFKLSYHD